jgi:hypothetical protein
VELLFKVNVEKRVPDTQSPLGKPIKEPDAIQVVAGRSKKLQAVALS